MHRDIGQPQRFSIRDVGGVGVSRACVEHMTTPVPSTVNLPFGITSIAVSSSTPKLERRGIRASTAIRRCTRPPAIEMGIDRYIVR